jgi:hypothetical protein
MSLPFSSIDQEKVNVDSTIVRACPEGNKRRLTLSKSAGARVRKEDGQSVDIIQH